MSKFEIEMSCCSCPPTELRSINNAITCGAKVGTPYYLPSKQY